MRPTIALFGWTGYPVSRETRRLVRAISCVLICESSPTLERLVRSSMTISSSDALPARSPMPLTAHSTCLAPAVRPAKEFATASPRSSWQWTETTTSFSSATRP